MTPGPCFKCGAARGCRHREYEAPVGNFVEPAVRDKATKDGGGHYRARRR